MTEWITEALAAHGHATHNHSKCRCGFPLRDTGRGSRTQAHRAHVTEVLALLIAERERSAWEKGRRHGEQNFISCPDDNPY